VEKGSEDRILGKDLRQVCEERVEMHFEEIIGF
jgi:hypothetical protein